MVRKRKSVADLLSFDEDSPLFVKKKTKTKTTKPAAEKFESVAEAASKGEPIEYVSKRKQRKKPEPKTASPDAPRHIIKSPDDCKHILPAFKKLLNEKWKMLEEGNSMEAATISNWIRGASVVVKDKRPKEFEELKVLIMLAKRYN
jgi:hypothetical protein